MDRVDFHPRRCSWFTGVAGNRNSNRLTSRQPSMPLRTGACGPHHIDHTGYEAEQKKHDETERRSRQQSVETPTDQPADNNTGDQLRGKLETARHARGSGGTISGSGLVSLDFAAVPNFGQPVIQTSEPCGKRGFVGRFIAIFISAVVRAIRHAVETETMLRLMEIAPRHPQKPRGPY